MAINFPDSPSIGDTYSSGNRTWQWDGSVWSGYGNFVDPSILKIDTVNNRVGVNNVSPTEALDVTGNATVSGSISSPTITSIQSDVSTAQSDISTAESNISTAQSDITTLETDVTNINELQINNQTASYTLVLSDAGKAVEMHVPTANNLTIPPNSSVAFPVGTQILVVQYGNGQTTLVPDSGVTLRSKDSNTKLSARFCGVTLIKRGTDEWYAIGDLTA